MSPRVQVPSLRAFLGSIACRRSASTSASGLPLLEGGLTESDSDVRDVVNEISNASVIANVTSYGATGDGDTASAAKNTIAFADAIADIAAAGGGELVIPPAEGDYYVSSTLDLSAIPGNIVVRGTGRVRASVNGFNLWTITNKTTGSVKFAKASMSGYPPGSSPSTTFPQSSNNGIYAIGCTVPVRVVECDFTDFRFNCVLGVNCTKIVVTKCNEANCARFVMFTGCKTTSVVHNEVGPTWCAATQFTIPIYYDSTDGHSYGVNEKIICSHNHVSGWPFCQAIELHAGLHVTIVGNVLDDVEIGVSLNPYNNTDTLEHVTISGNTINCSTTIGPTEANGNGGISVQAGSVAQVGGVGPTTAYIRDVSITNNVIRNFGYIRRDGVGYGIIGHYVEGMVIAANTLSGGIGRAIFFNQNVKNLTMGKNAIHQIGDDEYQFGLSNCTGNGVSPIVLTTGSPSGIANGDPVYVAGVFGNHAANGYHTATGVSGNNIGLLGTTGDGAYSSSGWVMAAISAATNASPIVVSQKGHGFNNGDVVLVKEVGGNTAANGAWVVTNKTANTYELYDLDGNASVGNGAYTSGGYAVPAGNGVHFKGAGHSGTIDGNDFDHVKRAFRYDSTRNTLLRVRHNTYGAGCAAKQGGSGTTTPTEGAGIYVAAETHPDVSGVTNMQIANSGATTITGFDNGEIGQELTLWFQDANTTINRTHAVLDGSANFTSALYATLKLVYDGTNWRQVGKNPTNG